jgi:hypothetical protein
MAGIAGIAFRVFLVAFHAGFMGKILTKVLNFAGAVQVAFSAIECFAVKLVIERYISFKVECGRNLGFRLFNSNYSLLRQGAIYTCWFNLRIDRINPCIV